MNSLKITVKDFAIFESAINALVKIVNQAKFMVDESGLTVYSMNSYARTELTSNCIKSTEPLEFCMSDISMLQKVLNTIKRESSSDSPDIRLEFDGQFIYVKSSAAKAKIITVKEDIIRDFVSPKKVSTVLTPIFEFITSSQLIKNVVQNTYIFQDSSNARIYLTVKSEKNEDLENNLIYATLDNRNDIYSNSMVLKFGTVCSGSLNRDIILDIDRIQLFSIMDGKEIKIQLMDKNVLVSEIVKMNDAKTVKLNLKIFNSIRKN